MSSSLSTQNLADSDPAHHDDTTEERPSLAVTRRFIMENLKASEGPIRRALAKAKRLGDRTELARCWLLYGFFRQVSREHAKALRCLNIALSLIGVSGNDDLRSEVENEMSVVYFNRAEFGIASEWQQRALKSARAGSDRMRVAAALLQAGAIHRVLGEYETALGELQQAYEIFDELGSRVNVATTYLMIGSVYGRLEDFEMAGTIYRKCLSLQEELGYETGIAEALICLGGNYAARTEYEKALAYYDRALAIWRTIGSNSGCARVLAQIGDTCMRRAYMEHTSYDTALGAYHEALELMKDRSDPMYEVYASMGIAEIFFFQGRSAECIELGERVLAMIEEHTLRGFDFEMHHLIADAYDALGDSELSLQHLRRYLEIKEDLLGYDVRLRVHELQSRIDAERAMREVNADGVRSRELKEEVSRARAELATLSLQVIYQQDLIRGIRESLHGAVNVPVLSEIRRRIDVQAEIGGGWELFERRLREMNPTFVEMLSRDYNLTPAELRVCSLLRLSLSSKEIAIMISIEPRSVDVYRLRIRKKLGLDRETNLVTFLSGL